MNNNFTFMAFAKGAVSSEGAQIKRYVGVAPMFCLTVCPDKKTQESIYNRQLDKDPVYIGENEGVKFANVSFVLNSDVEKCGVDLLARADFFIRNEYNYNRDKTKVQVIDKYGRTCWVTIEQAKNHEIPMYSNGPANIDKDYRPAYVGEEKLTNFLKIYLNIPNVMKYNKDTNTWSLVSNTQDCEARLEHIADYFKGNFSELKSALAFQPKNKVKALLGVRTADNGNQYQAVYTEMFLKPASTNYDKLEADLNSRKEAGAYPTTEFKTGLHIEDVKEWGVTPTDLSKPASASPFGDDNAAPAAPVDDLPFGDNENPADPFGY